MNRAGVPVGIGSRFSYDGEVIEVVEIHSVAGAVEALAKSLHAGTVHRYALSELMFSDRSRLLDDDLRVREAVITGDVTTVVWSAAPEKARQEARARAAHVREVLTGYRSGCAETAQPGEPRARYKPSLPMTDRIAAKAKEIHAGFRSVERWIAIYRRDGECGLISGKATQPQRGGETFALFEQAALDVMIELTDKSRPTKQFIVAHATARLNNEHGENTVPVPSAATAYRILEQLEKRHPTFKLSTSRNRDIAARLLKSYGKLSPQRPGEYLLMDTTRLDVFAMDPQTLRWVAVELTVGMDWYSRCITGLRLTPQSTKALDAAAVLYQCFRPMPAGQDWPLEAIWPAHGVPRSVLVEMEALDSASVGAATPAIVPETIVVDHGKIYVGEHLTSVCRQMGISIQPARLRRGQDKGPVERFFRTLRQGFLQELPGYKGPDLYSRGVAPEQEAFFFIDELEALLREWVATVYHRRPHSGTADAGLWSMKLTPAQMFEHGVHRAGYLEAPRTPNLAYHFLGVEWRTIQHSGVEIGKRRYRGEVLVDYIGEKSPYPHRGGLWPFYVNSDDIRQVYFLDIKDPDPQWHILSWTEAVPCPMNEDGLAFARKIAGSKHRYVDDKLALAELLERRKLSQGHTMAERRAALRLSREQHSLGLDLAASQPVASQAATRSLDPNTTSGDSEYVAPSVADELDDVPGGAFDDHFYDDVLDDV